MKKVKNTLILAIAACLFLSSPASATSSGNYQSLPASSAFSAADNKNEQKSMPADSGEKKAGNEISTTSNGTEDNSAPGSRGIAAKSNGDAKGGGSSMADATTADATDFNDSGQYWYIALAIIITIIASLVLFGRQKREDLNAIQDNIHT